MATRKKPEGEFVEPQGLDLGYLALFVGLRVNELVLEALELAGYRGLRHAHGYVFQHLLGGPRTITELAGLLGVSQQAASKTVAELAAMHFIEDAHSPDARARRVALSARGRSSVEKGRAIRAEMEKRFVKKHGRRVDQARELLAAVLEDLGGAEAVRTRSIRAPK